MSLAPAPSPNSLPNSKPQTLLLSVLSLGGRGKERKEGLRTWPGLSGPKLSWPTRLAGSQDSLLHKARRPANPPGLKPGRGDYRPTAPATPLKGTVRLGRTGRLPVPGGSAFSTPLAASLVSKGGGAASPLAVLWRGIGARAEPPAAAESQCNPASVARSGLAHPRAQLLLVQPGCALSSDLAKLGTCGRHTCPR